MLHPFRNLSTNWFLLRTLDISLLEKYNQVLTTLSRGDPRCVHLTPAEALPLAVLLRLIRRAVDARDGAGALILIRELVEKAERMGVGMPAGRPYPTTDNGWAPAPAVCDRVTTALASYIELLHATLQWLRDTGVTLSDGSVHALGCRVSRTGCDCPGPSLQQVVEGRPIGEDPPTDPSTTTTP